MKYRVRLMPEAEIQRDKTVEYYLTRSVQGAISWFDSFESAIEFLTHDLERYPPADESKTVGSEVHQINFGTQLNRPTHRLLFTIEGDLVRVLTLRRHSQDRWLG